MMKSAGNEPVICGSYVCSYIPLVVYITYDYKFLGNGYLPTLMYVISFFGIISICISFRTLISD